MRRLSLCHLLLAVSLACLASARATQAQVAPGQRLRIVQGVHSLTEGVYLGRDSLGYAVLLAGSDTVRVPMDGSYKAERFVGRQAYGVSAFMKSIAVGGGTGLALFVLSLASPNGESKAIGVAVSVFATAALTALGAVVGIVVAGLDHDVWQRVAFTPAAQSASVNVVAPERLVVDSTAHPGTSAPVLSAP